MATSFWSPVDHEGGKCVLYFLICRPNLGRGHWGALASRHTKGNSPALLPPTAEAPARSLVVSTVMDSPRVPAGDRHHALSFVITGHLTVFSTYCV